MQTILENKLYVIENFFTKEECNYIKNFIELDKMAYTNRYTVIEPHPNIVEKYKQKINTLPIDIFTISNQLSLGYYSDGGQGIEIHLDRRYPGILYKLLIYLNDDFEGGQTIFYKDNNILFKSTPVTGKAILFDVELYHEAKGVINGEKYVVGFRLLNNQS